MKTKLTPANQKGKSATIPKKSKPIPPKQIKPYVPPVSHKEKPLHIWFQFGIMPNFQKLFPAMQSFGGSLMINPLTTQTSEKLSNEGNRIKDSFKSDTSGSSEDEGETSGTSQLDQVMKFFHL